MRQLLFISSVVLVALCFVAADGYAQCNAWYELSDPTLGWEDRFGDDVAFAGDVNNDGYDDMLVGARRARRLYLYSGIDGSLLHRFYDYQTDTKSSSIAATGDMNADGYDDFVYGAGTSVRVISGIDFSVLLDIPAPAGSDRFGYAIDAGRDVNTDGAADILVGAWGTNSQRGAAYVFSGLDGSELYTKTGSFTTGLFGKAVALVGDMNGDGYAEFAISQPYYTSDCRGAVYLYSGIDGEQILFNTGGFSQEMMGWDMSRLGDVNGDGLADFIVGVGDYYQTTASGTKRAFIYESTADTATWLVRRILSNPSAHASFASTVGYVGDIDRDGLDDIGIGSYLCCSNLGAATIYSGADSTYSTIVTNIQGQYGDLRWLGFDIMGGGDVNGDGNSDLMIGSPRDLGARGSVQVFACFFPDSSCQAAPNADGDAHGDPCDNCPTIANINQADVDHDGLGDVCDDCTDTDGDGYGNLGYVANTCPDDNCPNIANANQADSDGDGAGDVCDNCRETSNPSQLDSDNDGLGNECDNCPSSTNANQADVDGDGAGDVCDNCTTIANADQTNSDSDIYGDVCDNCPTITNSGQWDADSDGLGNECDDCTDTDGDGFGNPGLPANTCDIDNCQNISNVDQTDADSDLFGDVCDNCPDVPNGFQEDWNNDGIGDSCAASLTIVEQGDSVVVDFDAGVTLTFETVVWSGPAEVNLVDSVDADPAPPNFSLLPSDGDTVFYNIDVQATLDGLHQVCITYDDTGMDAATELDVSMWHWQHEHDGPDVWVDVTSSIDTAANIVCGLVDQFSPFLVGVDGVPTDVGDDQPNVPDGFALDQNYPNPFNPTTVIAYTIPARAEVLLTIHNVLGQKIVTLIEGVVSPGAHSAQWNGRDAGGNLVSSGVYFYRLHTDSFQQTRKMILLK